MSYISALRLASRAPSRGNLTAGLVVIPLNWPNVVSESI